MSEYKLASTTRQLVACALAAGFLYLISSEGAVRPGPGPAFAAGTTGAPVSGPARVIDGDTIDIGDVRVRLEGIDAPESGQRCKRPLIGWWACGTAATAALTKLVDGQTVTCERHGQDKYGRMLGVCSTGGQEINAWMVRQGYAWAFVRYSQAYVQDEAAAKAARLGVWQAETQPPWEYRAGRWTAAEQQAPEGCAIKGNVTRTGRIYHMPWSPWYARIRIEPEKGKRGFCSEAEAIAAGWRPVEAH
jgi:endonuclease YncB( thermonuclease family)